MTHTPELKQFFDRERCKRKRHHKTRAKARKALRRWSNIPRGMNVYLCPFCAEGWVLGSKVTKRREVVLRQKISSTPAAKLVVEEIKEIEEVASYDNYSTR